MGTKKRGNGQGSVYKLANGKWCAERTIGYDAAGLRKTKKKSKICVLTNKRLAPE